MLLQKFNYKEDEFVPIQGMFFALPWAVSSVSAWAIMAEKKSRVVYLIAGVWALSVALRSESTLTIAGTVAYATSVCLSAKIFQRSFLKILATWLWIPLIMGMMSYGITNYSTKRLLATERRTASYEELQEQWSLANIKERINIKFYGDRSVLWAAGWHNVILPPHYIPELIKGPVYVETNSGSLVETDLGVHNYYLETLLECRWILGTGLIMIYILSLALASRWFYIKRIDYDFLPYAATVLACGYIHSTSANAVNSYPHLLLGFAGVMYGNYRAQISRTRQMGHWDEERAVEMSAGSWKHPAIV